MANDTPTLTLPRSRGREGRVAAYFYGRDIGCIWRVAEALEYGIVGINEGIISIEIAPFVSHRLLLPEAGSVPPHTLRHLPGVVAARRPHQGRLKQNRGG